MDSSNWYSQIIKPTWSPPAWLFGPVLTVLYAIIIVSFGYVAFLFFKGKIPFMVFLPFILNIIFNLAFSPIQFVWQNNFLAMLDIFLVLGTLVWGLVAIWPTVSWVALANIPYLLWVSFATVLQVTITFLNFRR